MNVYGIGYESGNGGTLPGASQGCRALMSYGMQYSQFPVKLPLGISGWDAMERIGDHAYAQQHEHGPSVYIGGDHTITYGIIDSLAASYEQYDLYVLDAHDDCGDNSLGHIDHGNWLRWLLMSDNPPANVFLHGVRTRRSDMSDLTEMQVWTYEPDVRQTMRTGNPYYVSIDIDAFDPGICPAVSCPVVGGLSDPIWWLEEIADLWASDLCFGLDIVEYNPMVVHDASTPRFIIDMVTALIHTEQ